MATKDKGAIGDVSRLSGAVLLAVVVSVLSFLGSLGGTYWATRFQREERNAERRFEQLQAVLEKQVGLIERTVAVINQGGAVSAARAAQASALMGPSRANKDPDDDAAHMATLFEQISGTQKQLAEPDSECAVVLTLDGLFFGPQTREAIKAMASVGDCWSSNAELREKLLAAMYGELGGFPYADTATR